MKNKDTLLGVMAVVAILVFAHLYYDNRRLKKKLGEAEPEEKSTGPVEAKLIIDENIQDAAVKKKMEELVVEFGDIDERVSNELSQCLQLFQLKQHGQAILGLAKIIEHLLGVCYREKSEYTEWLRKKNKRDNFQQRLDFSSMRGDIDRVAYGFILGVKGVRNKAAHEIDMKLVSDWFTPASFAAALGGIIVLSRLAYPKVHL